MKKNIFFVLCFLSLFSLCFIIFYNNIFTNNSASVPLLVQKVFDLQFINKQEWNSSKEFKNLPVGGLSALDYNIKKNIFLALSDDHHINHPMRFYKLKLGQNKKTKHYVFTLMQQVILQKKINQKILPLVDTEGIVFLNSDQVFISSEGGTLFNSTILPAISLFNLEGKWVYNLKIPSVFLSGNKKWGIKNNKGFESLSLGPQKKYLWTATETALRQDTSGINNIQFIRITRFNIQDKKWVGQFIYPMDITLTKHHFTGTTGLTDVVALGDKKLITLERTYLRNNFKGDSQKKGISIVRLFLTDCSLADNVSTYKKISNNNKFTICSKQELVDVSSVVGDSLDNIEGIVLGPKMVNKKRLLILVSDNNFNKNQKTQFLFFLMSVK